MKRLLSIVALFAFASAFAGCGGGGLPDASKDVAKINDTKMKKALSMYRAYQSLNDYKGPADESELKTFLKTETASQRLKVLGIDTSDLDGYFVSDRDNEPFTIRYGVKGSPMGADAPVIFESVGVDGTRQVGFLDHSIRETSNDKEYKQWLAGKFKSQGMPDRGDTSDKKKQNLSHLAD